MKKLKEQRIYKKMPQWVTFGVGALALFWLASAKLPIQRDYICIRSPKVLRPIRLALLTDTHSSRFGRNHNQLTRLLEDASPDLILLAGDIFDDVRDNRATEEMLPLLSRIAPTLYSSGNHDQVSSAFSKIPETLARHGIEFMDGRSQRVTIREQAILLSGVADPQADRRVYLDHLQRLPKTDAFHIVLSHRPHYLQAYAETGADLFVSGHAHGGQWRILGQGIYSPGQGLLPQYTKGLYTLKDTHLVVSPGLMRNYLPRLFNPPTVVIIDLLEAL